MKLSIFLILIIISILIRLCLAVFTEGTYDIEIWENHAVNINNIGITDYYKSTLGEERTFNHPPAIGKAIAFIYSICHYFNISFKIVFRLLFSLLDYVIAFYLYKILDRRKLELVAFYLLNPITFIFSSYHGNTDTSLGLFIILSIYFLSKEKPITAGIVFGLGVWIKWIIILGLVPIFFATPNLRTKTKFVTALAVASVAGYSWHLINAPFVMFQSVFGYTGQLISTRDGVLIWGNINIIESFLRSIGYFENKAIISAILKFNNIYIIAAVICYSWLRRQRVDSMSMGKTVGEVFIIFYGLTNYWAFQYFAWSAPFITFLSLPLLLSVTICWSGYIYTLYSLLCGSYFLLGNWDFIGHPKLSGMVIFFRNLSILICLLATFYLFFDAFRVMKNHNCKDQQT